MLAESPSLERLEGRVCSLTLPVRKWCLRLPALLGGRTWNIYQFYSESGWTEKNAKFQNRNMPLKITLCSRNCNYLLVSNSQSYGFSSSHVQMWELNPKEGWALKNWCFWTVVLEKILESSLNIKQIKPVNPKGINPEYSLEGLMLKLKLQYFGHLMRRANSLEKILMLGKTEGRKRSVWVTEDEMVGWHHQLNRHEFKQTPGASEGQGSLACYSP